MMFEGGRNWTQMIGLVIECMKDHMNLPENRQAFRHGSQFLRNGDHMSQSEFHEIYEKMPIEYMAELIDKTVYVSVPLGRPHGKKHVHVSTLFGLYEASTPGVEAYDSVSVILSNSDEVQPDLMLRILPRHGGRTSDGYDGYVYGAPELVLEVAHSSRSIDLHAKRTRYMEAGVIEYIVICLKPASVHWFLLAQGEILKPDEDGVLKSNVFPGLWMSAELLLKGGIKNSVSLLNQGLQSSQHASFVCKLKKGKQK